MPALISIDSDVVESIFIICFSLFSKHTPITLQSLQSSHQSSSRGSWSAYNFLSVGSLTIGRLIWSPKTLRESNVLSLVVVYEVPSGDQARVKTIKERLELR